MAATTNGASPDKRRKYDEAFKAEALRLASESRSTQATARQLGISSKLLYCWQQAQVMAEVGSVEVAREPLVRALCTANKQLAQELDILKKPWSSSASRPREYLPLYRAAGGPGAGASALPDLAGGFGCVLRLVSRLVTNDRASLASREAPAQQPRSFVPRTTDPDPAVHAAPNRMLGQLATSIMRVLLTDKLTPDRT